MLSLIQKIHFLCLFISFIFCNWNESFGQIDKNNNQISIVVHGGAGNFTREDLTEAAANNIREELSKALLAGYQLLKDGKSSVDVAIATIKILEDSPIFNAGKGAVYNDEGVYELDASIMDGKTRNAGAVSGLQHIKNPIELARLVMEKSKHVMLYGEGAEKFAVRNGFELVPNSYFNPNLPSEEHDGKDSQQKIKSKHGTVGVVAMDKEGNITAATSTGGIRNKKYGRIGDSPIIGAGTYANNATCGISCTGIGEYFMRGVIAYDISAMMEYKNISLQEAAEEVILNKLTEMGGTGGMIGLDSHGKVVTVFNTSGMIRGFMDKDGTVQVKFF